jgi:hypothetical protein
MLRCWFWCGVFLIFERRRQVIETDPERPRKPPCHPDPDLHLLHCPTLNAGDRGLRDARFPREVILGPPFFLPLCAYSLSHAHGDALL